MADHFPTVGVEEEYFLVDTAQRTVVAAAPRVLARAEPVLGDLVTGEASRYQVEGKTPPCATLGELRQELRRVRSAVVAAAADEGARPLACGTPLLGMRAPVPLNKDAHYRAQLATFRSLYDTFAFCGLHVHVQVPDRDHAVLVSNHLRPWLPVLVAMAANSPFWEERDSGYCSWRTLGGTRWPVAGPPPYFSSAAHYDTLASALRETGATLGERSLYWDVRPCAHLPTLEIRAMDVATSVEEASVFAVLVRALVVRALERVRHGDPGPAMDEALLRAAYWRCARDGLTGHSLDPRTHRLVPTSHQVRQLLAHARPTLVEHGELPQVTAVLRRLCAHGGGAERQRAVHARAGSLADVVDDLADRTAVSPGQWRGVPSPVGGPGGQGISDRSGRSDSSS
ncbi:YbdK family carboxylate-amine ligase [Streptomyces sp. BG9H]|uniref:Putative glutamate--cysteine ligase 2 n=1 Tax=Streptomyces anatolicus TaxID=2675858 RepID=A0ABS6YPC5_9ACTN|nr:glutamate--cysteine ligase [Streptomyces anatolicus]MBW5422397.1 YbdK family carboxylate-amine ligase [Streptomyces anatolicus]